MKNERNLKLVQPPAGRTSRRATTTKKHRILEAYQERSQDIGTIAGMVGARPSYVAQVLQQEGLIASYFDLYTHLRREQNIYARAFQDVLAFKTLAAAQESVRRIHELYQHYERLRDRAGQHQAMVVALIGFNRARWSGKIEQATQFRDWLEDRLQGEPSVTAQKSPRKPPLRRVP